MKIAWIGHSCFRMLSNGMTFVTDPFDETFGYKMPDIVADVITESHQHHDHNAHSRVKGKFALINDDGEYRLDGCLIRGIKTYHD
ncbi:MAG TPA: MBL fold metallo-hydrolase, partial [Petrotogaceae bacterium]|nr:MBL fold metallo-hydrolase [Petrotogaceae bacterium]